jgi:hypothetical protein
MTSSERIVQTRRNPPFLCIVRQLSQLRAKGASSTRHTPPVGRPGRPPAPPKRATTGYPPVALGTFQISGRISAIADLFADVGREPRTDCMGSGE